MLSLDRAYAAACIKLQQNLTERDVYAGLQGVCAAVWQRGAVHDLHPILPQHAHLLLHRHPGDHFHCLVHGGGSLSSRAAAPAVESAPHTGPPSLCGRGHSPPICVWGPCYAHVSSPLPRPLPPFPPRLPPPQTLSLTQSCVPVSVYAPPPSPPPATASPFYIGLCPSEAQVNHDYGVFGFSFIMLNNVVVFSLSMSPSSISSSCQRSLYPGLTFTKISSCQWLPAPPLPPFPALPYRLLSQRSLQSMSASPLLRAFEKSLHVSATRSRLPLPGPRQAHLAVVHGHSGCRCVAHLHMQQTSLAQQHILQSSQMLTMSCYCSAAFYWM